jgi:hypothetical protein
MECTWLSRAVCVWNQTLGDQILDQDNAGNFIILLVF